MMMNACTSFGNDSVIELKDAGNPKFAQGAFGDISIALFRGTFKVSDDSDNEANPVVVDGGLGRICFVALKTVTFSKEQTELGELNIWRQLCSHRNVLSLLAMLRTSNNSFRFVSEYCPTDLYISLEWRRRRQPQLQLSLSTIKLLMTDLISALQFMHNDPNFIIHNDVKPGNILISTTGFVKLCDFGLAQKFTPDSDSRNRLDKVKPSTCREGMTTLYYRSPEVLLGDESNNPAIDMYSFGLVLAELLLGRTLFQGRNEMDQLNKIFALLGTPSDVHWKQSRSLPHGSHFTFVEQQTKDVMEFIPRCTECSDLYDFARSAIKLDPEQRLTAKKGLQHPWLRHQPPEKESYRRCLLQKELIPPELVEPFIMDGGSTEPDLTVPQHQALDMAKTRRSFLSEMDAWAK